MAAANELHRFIQDLLQDLRGLEPLKRLFWSALNYERVNRPLSRRGRPESANASLAEDPLLFASHGDFHIIYSRLHSPALSLEQERAVLAPLQRDHPYALFLFSNAGRDRWHFLNVKYEDRAERRRLFRRITVGPGERLRTAVERLAMLDVASLSPDLLGLSPLVLQQRHDEAFDVEAVTRRFFEEYAAVFDRVEHLIEGLQQADRRRLFTQRLFNRLMFVAFIQKKGWLRLGGQTDYLAALWRAYRRQGDPEGNFYRDRLQPLFFTGLNTRHEIGSYYTPKPVVSFMGREALKGCLQTRLPGESAAALASFVDGREAGDLRDPEAVLEALRQVKVCDPACGSGAYLLGMLHELLDLRACLFRSRRLDPLSVYQRKLEILQNNLYGVDLDPFAVNIARLRLWLSLAVDFEGDSPPPLPNLDFKIEVGDSLLSPDPGRAVQDSFRQREIEEYLRLKARFMTAHGGEKQRLRGEISKAREGIVAWTHGGAPVAGFDWPVEFAEVFADGGFDVVLANPPYVRADAQFRHLQDEDQRLAAIATWKAFRAALLKSGAYQTLFEKWDLYMPFLERGYQLLRPGGRMVFIIPDAYNAAKYARRSHQFFVNNSRIERIDFCSDIPLFDAGVSNTIVHFARLNPPPEHVPVRARRWGQHPGDFDTNVMLLSSTRQSKAGPALFRIVDVDSEDSIRDSVALGSLCYVSKGMVVHSEDPEGNISFIKEDVVSDTRDAKHPKPFVEGKDLVRWTTRRVRYLEWGTERVPSKLSRPTFPQLHTTRERLLALRMSGDRPVVLLDRCQLFSNHTVVVFVPWHGLQGVRNKSIRKTARYRDEVKAGETAPAVPREDLEQLSRQYDLRYLLAVMNSSYATTTLSGNRRGKLDLLP